MNTEVINQIKEVLAKYFEADDRGNLNPQYDENFSAQNAIDEIASIVNQC